MTHCSNPVTASVTAIIADDEAPLRDFLRKRLATTWPTMRIVAEASNGIEAAELIAKHAPTVAFLDIKMPGLTGLEVAQGIESDTRVVFVTAFDQYALDAFEREAVDYLLKPVATDRLARTVTRLQQAINDRAPAPSLAALLDALVSERMAASKGGSQGNDNDAGANRETAGNKPLRWIRASRGNTTFHIPVNDVRYFISDDKYTSVHTVEGEHLIRTPLAELATGLDPDVFWQIHRGTIVNLACVAATRRDDNGRLMVQLRNDSLELPVSRAYAQRFRQM